MYESESIDRIIIPPVETQEIVRRAPNIYLRNCVCRERAKFCPPETWEVCLLFESAPQDALEKARTITQEEALTILHTALSRKVIYNLFYTHTTQKITELCSCCICCCSPLIC